MIQYTFRGNQKPSPDAQVVGEELAKIAQRNDGAISVEAIVKAAEKARSPLHKYFTWDDGEAAHQYRLAEARGLARKIVVVMEDSTQEPMLVNVTLQHEDDEPARRYVTVPRLQGDEVAQHSAHQAALSRLMSAQREIDELTTILTGKKAKRAKRAGVHVGQAIEEISGINIAAN